MPDPCPPGLLDLDSDTWWSLFCCGFLMLKCGGGGAGIGTGASEDHHHHHHHRKRRHRRQKHPCPCDCNLAFTSKKDLRRHVKLIHPGNKGLRDHKCPDCDFKSDYLQSLRKHKKTCKYKVRKPKMLTKDVLWNVISECPISNRLAYKFLTALSKALGYFE